MNITWIKKGTKIADGLEEGTVEISWLPGIPMEVLFKNGPRTSVDLDERKYLVEQSYGAANEIIKDPLTRRALFYNLHESELPIPCINMFHYMYRDGKLNLYVYARSINMENLGFDLCTIDKAYNEAFKTIAQQTSLLGIGEITFHIASLHYYG